ncbi:MAG TPA: hypothetical protein VFF79_06865 [Conexibacter sp.]|nr:hypothetical protein [Conexibacter sp.]
MLTALSAAVMLAALVGTASANRLSVSESTLRAVWPEESKLNFSNTAGGLEISCSVTLEGSFHSRSIVKTRGSLIGYITRAIVGPVANCVKNNVTNVQVLTASLPWHVRYDSFTGTLPAITGVRLQLVGAAFLLTAFGASCLYRSTPEQPAFGIANREAGGTITGLQAENGSEIPLASGGILCPASGTFNGTATRVTKLGETATIRLTLI